MKYENITPFVVIGFISALGIYDLIVFLQNGNTVSFYVWNASNKSPGLPILLGMVMGHFYFDKTKYTEYFKRVFQIIFVILSLQLIISLVVGASSYAVMIYKLFRIYTSMAFIFGVVLGHLYWNKSVYVDGDGNWKNG